MPEFIFKQALSPDGLPPVGTVDRATGVARLIPVDAGNLAAGFDYEGTTDGLYDSQTPTTDDTGRVLLTDSAGNEWYSELERQPHATGSKPPRHDSAVLLVDDDGEVSVSAIGTPTAMETAGRQWLLNATSGSDHTDIPVVDLLHVHALVAPQVPRPSFEDARLAWQRLQQDRKRPVYIHVVTARFLHAPTELVDPADASKLTDAELAAKVNPK